MSELLSQTFLADKVRERIVQAGYDLGPDDDLAAFEEGLRQRLEGPVAFLVLRSFELETYLRATFAFLEAQSDERLDAWARCFTRTVFLVGRPRQLAAAFPFGHLADDGSMAWLLSDDPKEQTRLLRLLQRLKTSGEASLPESFTDAPEQGGVAESRRVRAWIASTGLPLEDYLIHLNHLVCEAYLSGALRREDPLTLTHVGRIDALKLHPRAFRIHRDQTAGKELKLYGYLGVEGDPVRTDAETKLTGDRR